MIVRARRFRPGFVKRMVSGSKSGSDLLSSAAEFGGASKISAVAGALGALGASIFFLLELSPTVKCIHFLQLLIRLKLII